MLKIQDLVLVSINEKPSFYARVDEIVADQQPGWWVITLYVLTIPAQSYTWILDEHQLAGASFTMGGTPIRIELIPFSGHLSDSPSIPKEQPHNVIYFKPRNKS